MKFILNRLIYLLFVLFIAISGIFFLINKMPGDPAYGLAVSISQQRNMDINKALEIAHQMMGIDTGEPLFIRYVKFLNQFLRGNIGYSTYYQTTVNEIVAKSLPWTLLVVFISILISFIIGVYLGAFSAQKRGRAVDISISFVSSIIQAIPPFVLAVLILFIGAIKLRIIPLGGAYPVDMEPSFSIDFIISVIKHALGPIVAISVPQIAVWILAMRGNTSQIMEEDYIRFAMIRGVKDSTIARKYIRNNAILPLVASLAIAFGYMLGGNTLVESIFNYPGIGFYFGKAIAFRDYGLLTGLFSLIVVGVIIATFLAEILYSLIDPRVKIK